MFFETPKKLISLDMQTTILITRFSNIDEVLENLQGALEQLLQWFSANQLVANAESVTFLLVPKEKTISLSLILTFQVNKKLSSLE